MVQVSSQKQTSRPGISASTDRTVGFDPETQSLLDEIYAGADASSAKEFLDKYIWVKMWNHVRRLCTCEPTLEQLLANREALKSCMDMAHDLNLKLNSAKVASDRLRELYKLRK